MNTMAAFLAMSTMIIRDVAVDDMGYLFQILFLLFVVDVLTTLINSFVRLFFTNENLFEEFCRIMKKY